MSTITSCDYCGERVGRFWAKISVEGHQPDDGTLGWERLNQFYGHYCTEPQPGEDESCLQKVESAIFLSHSIGPTLENIPTISGQAVAARRRKHRKEDQ